MRAFRDNFLLMTLLTVMFSACFNSSEPQTIDALFLDPQTGAYAKLKKNGSFFYNTKPIRKNLFLEEEDPDLLEGAYSISSTGSLQFVPLDNTTVPIHFVLSKNQKRILVSEGFPGDEVNHMLVLYDPEQLHLFELHNL